MTLIGPILAFFSVRPISRATTDTDTDNTIYVHISVAYRYISADTDISFPMNYKLGGSKPERADMYTV